MTKEQYEKLVPYERTLMNAFKNNFVYMTSTDFSKVADIYAEVFSKPLTKSQMGCNTCRLNALKKLGEEYTKYKDSVEVTKCQNTKENSTPDIIATQPNETKVTQGLFSNVLKRNKSGRPKKLV